MPIYEYQCRTCEHVFEELILRATDEDELVCPSCHDSRPQRILSPTAVAGSSSGGASTTACVPRGGFS